MEDNYIKVQAIYKKIKQAETEKHTLYLSAPVGYGKTAAVRYYYRKKSALWLTCETGAVNEMLQPDSIKQSVIVIDDLSWITSEDSKEYILSLLEDKRFHIILIGRAKLPDWLKTACVDNHFIVANRVDLELSEEQAGQLLESFGVELPEEELTQLTTDFHRYGLSIALAAYELQNLEHYDEAVKTATLIDTFQYYDKAFYEKWSPEMRSLLMAVSRFERFTTKLAEMVTGNRQAAKLLAETMSIGDFMTRHEDGTYELFPLLRRYYTWKLEVLDKDAELKEIYHRAGIYYELTGEIDKALDSFEKSGYHQDLQRLLITNAKNHPGTGHYFETRKYYLELTEEEILEYPVLIAGISMLYSLLMQPERSEYWYDKLKEKEKNSPKGSSERKEATKRIAYLDISLPHRGTTRMVDLLKNAALMIIDKQMSPPEFSVTSNLPSIMNGGKDFCEWSKIDKELAKTMARPVELVLGKWGAGLVPISLAESYFEKGQTDYYQIMALLNSGYTKADMGGKIEMCFVSTAILSRIHIIKNQSGQARALMEQFLEKAKKENAERLIPNRNAFLNNLNLLEGKSKEIEDWMRFEAPNEHQDFYILDRYRYLSKVRTYLAVGRNEEAIHLIERLSVYFTEYKRTYEDMENQVLKAITQYRLSIEDWKDTLQQVLKRVEGYHFIYLVAREGIAVRELLQEYQKDSAALPVKEKFAEELTRAVDEMAVYYPNYLLIRSKLTEGLTDMEKKVLHLLCQGTETKRICDLCGFTSNTLKYHNRNLYRKLGASNRTEAVQIAKELGL